MAKQLDMTETLSEQYYKDILGEAQEKFASISKTCPENRLNDLRADIFAFKQRAKRFYDSCNVERLAAIREEIRNYVLV